jgi:hypothetical protein
LPPVRNTSAAASLAAAWGAATAHRDPFATSRRFWSTVDRFLSAMGRHGPVPSVLR